MSALVVKEAIRARLGRVKSRLEEALRARAARRKEKEAEAAMEYADAAQYMNYEAYMLAIYRGDSPASLVIMNKFPGDVQYFICML